MKPPLQKKYLRDPHGIFSTFREHREFIILFQFSHAREQKRVGENIPWGEFLRFCRLLKPDEAGAEQAGSPFSAASLEGNDTGPD